MKYTKRVDDLEIIIRQKIFNPGLGQNFKYPFIHAAVWTGAIDVAVDGKRPVQSFDSVTDYLAYFATKDVYQLGLFLSEVSTGYSISPYPTTMDDPAEKLVGWIYAPAEEVPERFKVGIWKLLVREVHKFNCFLLGKCWAVDFIRHVSCPHCGLSKATIIHQLFPLYSISPTYDWRKEALEFSELEEFTSGMLAGAWSYHV